MDRQVRNAPKRGNSTQLKVPRVLAGHRPQSLTSLSEPENNESFKPSKHVLERQRKWHQHAEEVQCHLNQRNWHQQASGGLGVLLWSETGKQHAAEGFTGRSRPQTAVSNRFQNPRQQACPRKAKEVAPTRQSGSMSP